MEVSGTKRLKTLEDEKHATEAGAGRRHAGQRGAEGPVGKEVVTPTAERKAVAHLMDAHGVSESYAGKWVMTD
jgi:hypothetical protein